MTDIKAKVTKAAPVKQHDSNNTAYVANTYAGTRQFANLYVVNAPYRSQDINKWKQALNAARNSYNPSRAMLQDLYEDIYLDAQVMAAAQKRIIGLTNKRWKYVLPDGTEDVEMMESVVNKLWFRDLIKSHQESVIFGPAVGEFIPEDGKIGDYIVLPRAHTVPEMGVVLKQVGDSAGYSYKADPAIIPYTLPIGNPADFGLLLPAAVWVIYKRGGMNALSKFCEIYGLPMRIGKYSGYNDGQRREMEKAFQNQGANSYLIIPRESEVEFIEANGTQSGDVFKTNNETCDAQIAKLFLGGTETLNSGTSEAQGNVHERGEDDIILSDILNCEYWLSEDFVNRVLIPWGYPVKPGGRFVADLTRPLNAAALGDFLAKTVPLGLKVPASFIYKKLGIPAPKEGEEVLQATVAAPPPNNIPDNADKGEGGGDDGGNNAPPDKPKKTNAAMHAAGAGSPVMQAVDKYYSAAPCCGPVMEAQPPLSDYDAIIERLIKLLYSGSKTTVDKALLEQTAKDLLNALTTGFNDGLNIAGSDADLLAQLTNNIYSFSGAKTYNQLADMRNMLIGDDGQVRSFADFKQAVLTNISPKYNQTYLAAEYNTTLATATEAARWQTIQQDKAALPFLRYSAVLDERTRDTHAALDGTVKPVDDPFWDTYYPPIDWNCRCTILQIDADEAASAAPTDAALYPEVKDLFKNNAGKSGQVFTDAHPYFSGIDPKAQKAIDKTIGTIRNQE